MTQITNNPPPAKPSQLLRLVRIAIGLGLLVGISIFAVFAIEELKAGSSNPPLPHDFGANSTASNPSPTAMKPSANPLAGLTSTDPSKFIPILRENPHPGEIKPFLKADPFGQAPYRQPAAGGEVWEFCVYQVRDASLTDLVSHYDQQAKARGMRLKKQQATSSNLPGGMIASWSDGSRGLEVTAIPLPLSEPTRPPLAPPTPLRWVVKYSYPDPIQTKPNR